MGKPKQGSKGSKFKPRADSKERHNNGKPAHGNKKQRPGNFKNQDKGRKNNPGNDKPDNNKKSKGRNMNKQKRWKAPESDSEFEEVGPSLVSDNLAAEDRFPTKETDIDADAEVREARKLVQQQNRKKKKSGGFQSMGLSHPVYKGVIRKGYKIPTPIQRKTIPLIMDGKDVVAMARTGSGKTAAFLIPMFERLNRHLTTGARALIMAPTRELALQTLKFTKELGRFTGLKSAVVLGGDSMEEQFAALHENPDIIIATPGRFMHVLVEMELKLSCIEYIVFDEADRLFELGFQEQLREILQRVPENRQTVLFSATLPKLLVEFAKAGLHDPTLLRLDVDTKLSENLKMAFLQVQTDNKVAALLHFLRTVIKPSQQTVVFAATKHHVDFLQQILTDSGFECSYSYSSLDQTARKINVAKFRNKKTMILIVTDLAARGIDIPLLDNVINYNFPAKSKLFVHRVGRVARAGRSGTAYSLVSPDEIPYVLDLHLFLGRPLQYVEVGKSYPENEGLFGLIPQSVIDDEEEHLRLVMKQHDIQALEKVTKNAYKHYIKSRPAPSSESIKRIKEMAHIKVGFHPLYGSISVDVDEERAKLLLNMKNFKPRGTIFEVNTHKKAAGFNVMKMKRDYHRNVIERNMMKQQEQCEERALNDLTTPSGRAEADDADVNAAFSRIVAPKPTQETKIIDNKKKKRKVTGRDEQFYLEYRPKDFESERGLSLKTSFDKEADNAAMDIAGDDATILRKQTNETKWDRKRKKFVKETGFEPGKKRMKTESGHWISSTYKSNIYKDWLDRTKIKETEDVSDEDEASQQHRKPGRGKGKKGKFGPGKPGTGFSGKQGPKRGEPKHVKGNRNEIKHKDQILKERRRKDKLRSFMKSKEHKRQQHRSDRKK